MLRIRNEQLVSLRNAAIESLRRELARIILRQLREDVPDIMKRYPEERQQRITEDVLDAADRLGVSVADYMLNWCYIRFFTDMPFYDMEQFKDILDHSLLHPDAKARHIVMSFFSNEIQRRSC
jgi:hypothetical protein